MITLGLFKLELGLFQHRNITYVYNIAYKKIKISYFK